MYGCMYVTPVNHNVTFLHFVFWTDKANNTQHVNQLSFRDAGVQMFPVLLRNVLKLNVSRLKLHTKQIQE